MYALGVDAVYYKTGPTPGDLIANPWFTTNLPVPLSKPAGWGLAVLEPPSPVGIQELFVTLVEPNRGPQLVGYQANNPVPSDYGSPGGADLHGGRLAPATAAVRQAPFSFDEHRFVFYMRTDGELGALETDSGRRNPRHLDFGDLRRNTPGIPALDRESPLSACTSSWGGPMVAVRSWTGDELVLLYRISQGAQGAFGQAKDDRDYWGFFVAPNRNFDRFGFGDLAVGGSLLCAPGVKGSSDDSNIWGVDQGQLDFGGNAVATNDYVLMTSRDGHLYKLTVHGAIVTQRLIGVANRWTPAALRWEDLGPFQSDLPGYALDTVSDCLAGGYYPGAEDGREPSGLHVFARAFDPGGNPCCVRFNDSLARSDDPLAKLGDPWIEITQGDGMQDNWPRNRLVFAGTPGLKATMQPGFYSVGRRAEVLLWSANPYFWNAPLDASFPVVCERPFDRIGARWFTWFDGAPPP